MGKADEARGISTFVADLGRGEGCVAFMSMILTPGQLFIVL